ncbi:AraC family transcriptional regulator [Pseudomaricurvus alkylphenolicus]|uniref:AraC family transcriptional regulator n=1 Tax=Pseudomaricurvus alkylphenolicus TaxID=1306991 RepID=UPI001421E171|nr:AraC family transcriptional regulator [Pseudomaricurvus alkylphenolicus]NIB38155.1 AraC family transcriptional regulator [Pseudomaricurvus alkylphenolicus]
MSVVYARSLNLLSNLAEALGVPFEPLAREAGVDPRLVDLVDATIPAENYLRLHKAILHATQNPDFGLLMGRVAYIENFHLYMYLASASKTLKEWINLVPNAPNTMSDLVKTAVTRKGEHLILAMEFNCPPDPVRCLVTDHLLSLTAMLMDGFSLLPVRPTRVNFSYQHPGDISALSDVFRAPLYFEQPVSALYYDVGILELPQVHVATQVYDGVRRELDNFLPDLPWSSDPFSVSLYSAIRHQLPAGNYSVIRIAEELGISSRTLQRRLQERETNYQKFLQEVRSSLAAKYLEDQALTVTDIALLLGYGDLQSFSTAFKSWQGITPSEFRRR